ncbi:MAG: hypothetical protein KIT74_10080 [Fimbriimonadales bacterium]|nr:hypothetical protein [Fimbriimonadales bacterium]
MRGIGILAGIGLSAILPAHVTSPKEFFGHEVGADYYLSNFQQMHTYWKKLDAESERMQLKVIGKTSEGRDQIMAIVTSPANFKKLEEYRSISKRLAMVKGLSDLQARELAKVGKAVVWIDGGLHSTETLGPQQLIETVYRLLSNDDEETLRILNDVIILFVHANPDGMDLVSNWYMREEDQTKRAMNIPRLYQKYIGHDNNRDFYAATQIETQNMNHVMYREWLPQIMYNHHQTGPAGTVMFAPPFRDPFNHRIDPGVMSGIDLVGAAMMQRFVALNMPGVTTKTGASYSAWWNGGLRTTAYFHNIIGILTETIGSPTPSRIPFVAGRRVPQGNLIFPIEPREWKFRYSVEYSVQANMAILDLASRFREKLLLDIYQMGKRQVLLGSKDSWTDLPSKVEGVRSIQELRKPELRNPRGFIIPSDQPEFPLALRFANSLMSTGVIVHRATNDFWIRTTRYPAGSLVFRCDQPFRAHVLDMFEPQDHPNDVPAPGAAPIPPYDVAGYTYAFQMGFQFDRILDAFGGPFEELNYPIDVESIRHQFDPANTWSYRDAFARMRRGDSITLAGRTVSRSPKIALWDRYGGSMPSGWTRWIFDTVGIDYRVVFPAELDQGNLKNKYDVIVLPSGAVPANLRSPQESQTERVPEEFHHMLGSISQTTVTKLREFLEEGGTLIAVGTSTTIAYALDLGVEDALSEGGRALPRSRFYIPGSLLEVQVDTSFPVASGMDSTAMVMFSNSPTFTVSGSNVRPIARYGEGNPLRSGWILGPEYLQNKVAIAEADVGRGRLFLFAPEITFRGQSWGTFRLLFNAILLAGTAN